ncbi:MAG: AAA family ATPase [Alphaproteobacteria bacterium]|nr:AAA family ATPase [Alphaproteobacteria bacterium]
MFLFLYAGRSDDMYANYFNFSEMPFSLLPDCAFLYPSRKHEKVINMLDYGLASQTGFVVITGEVGAGKTTLLRTLVKKDHPSLILGMITNPSPSFGSLMKWVVHAFDIKTTAQDTPALYDAFVTFLIQRYGQGKRAVLIIDEAQNMKADMLEELRMLSNVNNEKDQLLQIIMVGQPELLETLKGDNLRQFVQRIGVHCHLDPLSPAETAAYIRHRLHHVGGREDLFDNEALAAVYHLTFGIPRLINLLCDLALVYAFSEDATKIDLKTVMEAVKDRASSGLSAFRALPEHASLYSLSLEIKPHLVEMARRETI